MSNSPKISKQVLLPRPGSLADRLTKKYGDFWGGQVIFNTVVGFLAIPMLVFLLLVVGCALIVINAANYISSTLSIILIGIVLIWLGRYVFVLRKTDSTDFSKFLDRYFSIQVTISGMAFVQTFFWMIDSNNSIHEPCSVFLLSMSVALAYFRDRYVAYVQGLLALQSEQNH